jgi:hypothetical protein
MTTFAWLVCCPGLEFDEEEEEVDEKLNSAFPRDIGMQIQM